MHNCPVLVSSMLPTIVLHVLSWTLGALHLFLEILYKNCLILSLSLPLSIHLPIIYAHIHFIHPYLSVQPP